MITLGGRALCLKVGHQLRVSLGSTEVLQRGTHDLLDLALVDVDAGAEGGGLGESSVRDEKGTSMMATSMAIPSRRRKGAVGKAAAAVLAAAARDCGAADAARMKRAC